MIVCIISIPADDRLKKVQMIVWGCRFNQNALTVRGGAGWGIAMGVLGAPGALILHNQFATNEDFPDHFGAKKTGVRVWAAAASPHRFSAQMCADVMHFRRLIVKNQRSRSS